MAISLPYRPSNGTEGEIFMARFCDRCTKDNPPDDGCDILCASLAFGIDEPEYPKEWVKIDGQPRCTAFETRADPVTGLKVHKPSTQQKDLFPSDDQPPRAA